MPEILVKVVERLLEDAQIEDVRCIEISARALDVSERRGDKSAVSSQLAADADEAPARLQFKVQQESDHIAVRGRVELESKEAHAAAEVAAFYSKPADVQYSRDVLEEFARRVGMPTIWPYLREAIAEATRRVGVDPHILGMLHLGHAKAEATVEPVC